MINHMKLSTEESKDTKLASRNWEDGNEMEVLHRIHQRETNIAICNRSVNQLSEEINLLIAEKVELRLSGNIRTIKALLQNAIDVKKYPLIIQDIELLLHTFEEVTKSTSFQMLLATINTNMCRKFHTDINELRMLCTYSGPGTLWLTDENINRTALNSIGNKQSIVIDENQVRQVETGAVAILKGAIYPQSNSKAVVHRSPTIEESGSTRLLLRIDSKNNFL